MAKRSPYSVGTDSQRPAIARYSIVLLTVVVVTAGCTSDESKDMDISFETRYYSATAQNDWVATGTAVDEGVICASATGTGGHFENTDGSELTEAELGRLNDGTDPFTWVGIGEFRCDDGSGSFSMRTVFEAENPAAFLLSSTWELEGGENYGGVSGEGEDESFWTEGAPVVLHSTYTGIVRED